MNSVARRRRNQGGYSFIELMIALSVMAVGALTQASLTVTHYRQTDLNKELIVVAEAARSQLEIVRGTDFGTVLSTFHGTSAQQFDVDGLAPAKSDKDGRVGRVLFPMVGNDLREDVKDARLGMPADLDSDGKIDALPKNLTYRFLPVTIEIRWQGKLGDRVFRLDTVLVDTGS